MAKSRSGRSLKKYELSNLLFFLVLIAAFGVVVTLVFRHYGMQSGESSDEGAVGVVSEAVGSGSDIGLFYLDTKLSETTRRYKSRLEIPPTDDGLVRELFALPGVEEVTIDQKVLILKKNGSSRWESIQPGVRRIVKDHLHIHY
ncbi:MAG TPA: NifU N-terminal domain-containing protein [Acidobacteriota bacterium]|nr:NifU N-terminal domain-containing protein [Acidobacteriota bacterium]